MFIKTIEEPNKEPITLAEVYQSARVDSGILDSSISLAIKALRRYGESYTARKFITTELELTLPRFPVGAINLMFPDVQEIVSIVYVAADGSAVDMDVDALRLVAGEPCHLYPAYQSSWPTARSDPDAVRVVFKAGFGDCREDVPAEIRQWLIARAVQLVMNPDGLGGEVRPLPFLDGLLDTYASKGVF